MKSRYRKKTFFVAQTDNFSLEKVKACSWLDQSDYEVVRIPRSREVKQSWVTTVWTTALATAFTLTQWRKIGRLALKLCRDMVVLFSCLSLRAVNLNIA